MAAALAKLAIPVVLGVIALVAGGKAKAADTKPYDAGYAHGKADAIAGKSKDPSPISKADVKGATDAEIAAYNKGYSEGYDQNKKVTPGPGGGGVSTPVNKYDQETSSQAMSRGYASGLADGRQDGSASNGYGYTHTKSPYTRSDLKAAYESQWTSGYAKGYAEGVKIKEDGGGIVIGDVLGNQGHDPRSFRPHSNVATGGWGRESLRRPGGYPRDWYNY